MSARSDQAPLEEQISLWRAYLHRRRAMTGSDVEELEAHLRDQVGVLTESGLAEDEAFLIAVKRLGSLDAVSREFAREHSERLWKQLVMAPDGETANGMATRMEAVIVLALATAAAVAVKVPAVFGLELDKSAPFYARNASLFVLPFLTAYFVWKRRVDPRLCAWLALAFGAAAVIMNVFPFARGAQHSHTEVLSALHLPITLWLVVGIAYVGGRWFEGGGRMNFVRFSGELFIYYVLIALGGGVLTAFTIMMFEAIGTNAEWIVQGWLIPCGAAGALIVGSWLVEAKQGVIENMAPVLTRLFTPLFAALLILFLGTVLWTGRGVDIARNVLIGFDLLLVVVIGLLLYSISARDPSSPRGAFDVLQVLLLLSALLTDAVALSAIARRITEFGFSPNRVAALGENVILLVNLAWSAVLYIRFLRGHGSFTDLERWQTRYVPVYSVWATIVVIVFPPLFGYV